MADIVGELKVKRQRIEEIIKAQDQREGELKAVMDQLKADFGVVDIDAANIKRETLNGELDDNESEMDKLDMEMGNIIKAAGR